MPSAAQVASPLAVAAQPPPPLPMSPRGLLAETTSSDFFLLMRNASADEDAAGIALGSPALGPAASFAGQSRSRLDAGQVRRRKSVVGNIKFSKHEDDSDSDGENEENDGASIEGSLNLGPSLRPPSVIVTPHADADETASIESADHRGLNLEFLAKWQESMFKSSGKKDGITRTSTVGSAISTYEINGSSSTPRFTLYSPTLPDPISSPTFNFSPSLLASQPWFWIDVLDATDSEMLMFSRVFHLHPLTSEDIIEGRVRRDGFGQVGNEGREKLELYPGYYFVLVRAVDPHEDDSSSSADDEISGVNLNIVVSMRPPKSNGCSWILSFHSRPLPAPQHVRARHAMLQSYEMSAGPDWICYALLDAVVDSFAPEIKSTELEASSIEDLVLMLRKESQEELLHRINESKRRVMDLIKLLFGKPNVLKSMRRRLLSHYTSLEISELALYLSDVGDNLLGLQSNLNFQEQTLARAHGTYLARVQIEIQDSAGRSNDLTNKITLLAVSLTEGGFAGGVVWC